jgi:hypothetical protein
VSLKELVMEAVFIRPKNSLNTIPFKKQNTLSENYFGLIAAPNKLSFVLFDK